MMRKKYAPALKAEIKYLFINEGLSAQAISRKYKGRPSSQTVINWARVKNPDTGLDWFDEKRQYETAQYNRLSPESLADKLLEKINHLASINNESFTSKDADALTKLAKNFRELTDVKHQLPVMFQLLNEFLSFVERHYKELYENKTLINAIREFKNRKIDEMEKI